MVSSGLDFSGTTEMMLDTTWTFKNKIVVERQPDSRKCLTCFIRDDMMCPLATALEGVRRYVPWGQTHTDGTSLTPRCGFCFKHFNSVVRYSRVPPVKLEEYEAQLGASEKLLELHVARITMLIHECIKRGRMDFRVNWEGIEKKALRVVQRKSMIKTKTGYRFMPNGFYEGQYGDLQTNGQLSKGHRPWVLDGEHGVIIPDDPVTYIAFEEELSVMYEQEVGSCEDLGEVT